jgi:hypothetical protein
MSKTHFSLRLVSHWRSLASLSLHAVTSGKVQILSRKRMNPGKNTGVCLTFSVHLWLICGFDWHKVGHHTGAPLHKGYK